MTSIIINQYKMRETWRSGSITWICS